MEVFAFIKILLCFGEEKLSPHPPWGLFRFRVLNWLLTQRRSQESCDFISPILMEMKHGVYKIPPSDPHSCPGLKLTRR